MLDGAAKQASAGLQQALGRKASDSNGNSSSSDLQDALHVLLVQTQARYGIAEPVGAALEAVHQILNRLKTQAQPSASSSSAAPPPAPPQQSYVPPPPPATTFTRVIGPSSSAQQAPRVPAHLPPPSAPSGAATGAFYSANAPSSLDSVAASGGGGYTTSDYRRTTVPLTAPLSQQQPKLTPSGNFQLRPKAPAAVAEPEQPWRIKQRQEDEERAKQQQLEEEKKAAEVASSASPGAEEAADHRGSSRPRGSGFSSLAALDELTTSKNRRGEVSATKVFVWNLDFSVTSADLKAHFEEVLSGHPDAAANGHGSVGSGGKGAAVVSAAVFVDKTKGGASKGSGMVTLRTSGLATEAMAIGPGSTLRGRDLFVGPFNELVPAPASRAAETVPASTSRIPDAGSVSQGVSGGGGGGGGTRGSNAAVTSSDLDRNVPSSSSTPAPPQSYQSSVKTAAKPFVPAFAATAEAAAPTKAPTPTSEPSTVKATSKSAPMHHLSKSDTTPRSDKAGSKGGLTNPVVDKPLGKASKNASSNSKSPPPAAHSAAEEPALTAHQAQVVAAVLGGAVEASGGKLLGPAAIKMLASFSIPGLNAGELVPNLNVLEALVSSGQLPGFTYAFNILRRTAVATSSKSAASGGAPIPQLGSAAGKSIARPTTAAGSAVGNGSKHNRAEVLKAVREALGAAVDATPRGELLGAQAAPFLKPIPGYNELDTKLRALVSSNALPGFKWTQVDPIVGFISRVQPSSTQVQTAHGAQAARNTASNGSNVIDAAVLKKLASALSDVINGANGGGAKQILPVNTALDLARSKVPSLPPTHVLAKLLVAGNVPGFNVAGKPPKQVLVRTKAPPTKAAAAASEEGTQAAGALTSDSRVMTLPELTTVLLATLQQAPDGRLDGVQAQTALDTVSGFAKLRTQLKPLVKSGSLPGLAWTADNFIVHTTSAPKAPHEQAMNLSANQAMASKGAGGGGGAAAAAMSITSNQSIEIAAALGAAVDASKSGSLMGPQVGEVLKKVPAFKMLNEKASALIASGTIPGFEWANNRVSRLPLLEAVAQVLGRAIDEHQADEGLGLPNAGEVLRKYLPGYVNTPKKLGALLKDGDLPGFAWVKIGKSDFVQRSKDTDSNKLKSSRRGDAAMASSATASNYFAPKASEAAEEMMKPSNARLAAALGAAIYDSPSGFLTGVQAGIILNMVPGFKLLNEKASALVTSGAIPGFQWVQNKVSRQPMYGAISQVLGRAIDDYLAKKSPHHGFEGLPFAQAGAVLHKSVPGFENMPKKLSNLLKDGDLPGFVWTKDGNTDIVQRSKDTETKEAGLGKKGDKATIRTMASSEMSSKQLQEKAPVAAKELQAPSIAKMAAVLGAAVDACSSGFLMGPQAGEVLHKMPGFKLLDTKPSFLVASGAIPGFQWANNKVSRLPLLDSIAQALGHAIDQSQADEGLNLPQAGVTLRKAVPGFENMPKKLGALLKDGDLPGFEWVKVGNSDFVQRSRNASASRVGAAAEVEKASSRGSVAAKDLQKPSSARLAAALGKAVDESPSGSVSGMKASLVLHVVPGFALYDESPNVLVTSGAIPGFLWANNKVSRLPSHASMEGVARVLGRAIDKQPARKGEVNKVLGLPQAGSALRKYLPGFEKMPKKLGALLKDGDIPGFEWVKIGNSDFVQRSAVSKVTFDTTPNNSASATPEGLPTKSSFRAPVVEEAPSTEADEAPLTSSDTTAQMSKEAVDHQQLLERLISLEQGFMDEDRRLQSARKRLETLLSERSNES